MSIRHVADEKQRLVNHETVSAGFREEPLATLSTACCRSSLKAKLSLVPWMLVPF